MKLDDMSISIPIESVEGLLSAIEGFFGPDIFAPMTTSEPKTVSLNKFGREVKYLVDKKRSEEAAAKEIYDAAMEQLDEADKENLQEILDEAIHDACSEDGSDTNNQGFEDQILFLIEELGEDAVRKMLLVSFEGRLDIDD